MDETSRVSINCCCCSLCLHNQLHLVHLPHASQSPCFHLCHALYMPFASVYPLLEYVVCSCQACPCQCLHLLPPASC
ncbi:hypothetical protein CHARACLAT_022332 [Characodon lateralis]|uniref:Uncharacterized protein n=1 Tax=Characodon lateralis TaxID=208331 RepID=A0ABU7DIW1_9TELE|nr:hypothetical protein [Characodon lateralis]